MTPHGQVELSDILKQQGIKRSLDHANRVHDNWSERALSLLKNFLITNNTPFMAENFRDYAIKNGLEEPPHKRAFGGIMTKAKTLGWIRSIGLGPVSNPYAHKAFATIWKTNI